MATSSARKTAPSSPTQTHVTNHRRQSAAPAAAGKPSPSPTVKADKKKTKHEKIKVVRDSFTIPKSEYTQIATLKQRAMGLGIEAKKSELIRAGLLLLSATTDAALRKALDKVPTLKTGRPSKG